MNQPFPSSSSSSSCSLNTNPLFSTIITISTLILIYFPHIFFNLILSPLLISTSLLLFSLLCFFTPKQSTATTQETHNCTHPQSNSPSGKSPIPESGSGSVSDAVESASFVRWDVTAPLEVIYEEGDDEGENDGGLNTEVERIERYPSLSRYYPETDSESEDEEAEIEIPMIGGWSLWWKDEVERDEGLIEIELGCDRRKRETEEEGFFEIELFR